MNGHVADSIYIIVGWTGLFWEFLRPGRVVPGVAGGVLLLVGLSRMLPEHRGIAIGESLPFILAASWLLSVAWKARRNKRSL